MSESVISGVIRWRGARSHLPCHVSNGENIVLVGKDDRFALAFEPGRHRFIFVIPPGDSQSVGPFWHNYGPQGADDPEPSFLLKMMAAPPRRDPLVLHVTDTHLRADQPDPRNDAHYCFGKGNKPQRDTPTAARLSETLRELLASAGDVDFLVVTGDITDMGESEALKAAADIFASLPVPTYPIFGGHDGNTERAACEGERRYCAEHFTRHLAPPYYSWNWGDRHFLSFVSETHFLDSQADELQHAFVENDLQTFGEKHPVTICSHKHPYPWNIGPFLKNGRSVDSWLHGHFHSDRVHDEGAIRIFSTGTPTMGGYDQTRVQARVIETRAAERPTGRPIALITSKRESPHHESKDGLVVAWQSSASLTLAPLARPCVIDQAIYCGLIDTSTGTQGGVVAIDHHGGQLWKTDCRGSFTAPIVSCGSSVIAVAQTGKIVSLNRHTGERQWTHELPDVLDRWLYAPPLVVEDSVIIGTTSLLTRLALHDGRLLWQHRHDDVATDAFCQLQGPAHHHGHVLLPGYATPAYRFDLETGRVIGAGDDQRIRYASRHTQIGERYFVGDLIGRLYCFDLSTGLPLWETQISQQAITSGARVYRDSLIVGTAEGIGRYALGDGRQLAFHGFGKSRGMDVPNRADSQGCPGTPCVVGEQVWAASSDGYLNVLDASSLNAVDRLELHAPVLSPLACGRGELIYGINSKGVLLCLTKRTNTT